MSDTTNAVTVAVATLKQQVLGTSKIRSLETHVAALVTMAVGVLAMFAPGFHVSGTAQTIAVSVGTVGAVVLELFHINLKREALRLEADLRGRFAHAVPAPLQPIVDGAVKDFSDQVSAKLAEIAPTPAPVVSSIVESAPEAPVAPVTTSPGSESMKVVSASPEPTESGISLVSSGLSVSVPPVSIISATGSANASVTAAPPAPDALTGQGPVA